MREIGLCANGVSLGKKQVENSNVSFDVLFSKKETFLYVKGVWNEEMVEDAMTIHFTPVPSKLHKQNIEGIELAINVGNHCFYTSGESHLIWLPDQKYTPGNWGYVGGKQYNTTNEIENTLYYPLYQSMRTDLQSYCFDVPEGIYELEMLFSDVFYPKNKVSIF